MKLKYLIKAAPFLTTLLLIVFLSINNQKEYTKLKILIWTTPTLKLGSYLALSTAAGFILSYLTTNQISKIYQTSPIQSLKPKLENHHEEIDEYIEPNNEPSYDKTLIERDIKDPSPTINASFRIIGIKERSSINYTGDNNLGNDEFDEFADQYKEESEENEFINKVKSNSSDWNDESFSKW